MPGTPDEYMGSPDFDQAEDLIDEQLQSGEATGDSILSALMGAGMRVYPEGSMEGDMPEGLPEEMLEEPMEEEMPMGEEMPEGEMMEGDIEAPDMGGGDAILEAARFGMDEDKKKKSKRQEDLDEYL